MRYKHYAISSALLVLAIFAPVMVSAQTSEEELQNEDMPAIVEDVPGLRAEFVQNAQSPWNKEIEFIMKLNSGIDSDRVKVTWTITGPSIFTNEALASRSATIKAGQDYSVPIILKPVGQGVNELVGKVEAFKADGIYTVTVRKNFATNASGEVLPLSEEYKSAKTMRLIVIILGGTVGVLLGVFVTFFGFKKFVKWLNRDDEKAYGQMKST